MLMMELMALQTYTPWRTHRTHSQQWILLEALAGGSLDCIGTCIHVDIGNRLDALKCSSIMMIQILNE